jgi:hypothetical protein
MPDWSDMGAINKVDDKAYGGVVVHYILSFKKTFPIG